MPLPLPENRKRRWAPKVRSGCLTCKRRKKRCDEGRPTCQTCRSGKYVCDGYDPSDCPPTSLLTSTPIEGRFKPRSPLSSLALCPSSKSWQYDESSVTDSYLFEDVYYTFLANAHLNAALSESNQTYAQFFVVRVAPVLATTTQWRSFWELTVPQISLKDSSIYHAMIALAATYESKASKVDRRTKALREINQAVRATLSGPLSTTNTLILCRLLASIAQATGDWKMAVTHLQHGWKILRDAAQSTEIDSDLARLLAPTFLCASTERVPQRHIFGGNGTHAQLAYSCLEGIRCQFLAQLSARDWNRVEGHQKSFILTCWSIMTQTSCSLLFADALTESNNHEMVSPHDIRSKLRLTGWLMTLDELKEKSRSTFEEMEACLRAPTEHTIPWSQVKQGMQLVVENFVAQAMTIKPDLDVGTFWFHEKITCDIEEYIRSQENTLSATSNTDNFGHFSKGPMHQLSPSYEQFDGNITRFDLGQQKRAHYVEFICPYRSGLMPAFINGT